MYSCKDFKLSNNKSFQAAVTKQLHSSEVDSINCYMNYYKIFMIITEYLENENDLRSEVFKYVAAICIQDAQCLCKVMPLKKSSDFKVDTIL